MSKSDEPIFDPNQAIPKHIAIIMDGNGRWAKKRGLARLHGHRKGVETVKSIVKAARSAGVEFLTLYSFSTENWSRPREEVSELMNLLKLFIRKDLAELHQNNVCVRIIGDRENLPDDIGPLLLEAETLTKDNDAQTLAIAFNYGSRNEIVRATQKLARQVSKGDISPDQINENMFSASLDTNGIPDPDLIIRTSGECRLSNFLMWQAAYSELYFVEKMWPEFKADDLQDAITYYTSRNRTFGGLKGEQAPKEVARNE